MTMEITMLLGVYCCADGDLRINNDFNATVNIVQVCAAGKWSFICGNNWFRAEATVVCQQMGFKVAGKMLTTHFNLIIYHLDTFQHSGFSPILSKTDQYIGFMNCAGIERRLLDCSHTGIILPVPDTCLKDGKYVYATVTCIKGMYIICMSSVFEDLFYVHTEENIIYCTNGDLRHSNDTLERCITGKWDRIYLTNEESWNENHARVACRQLGLNPEGNLFKVIQNYILISHYTTLFASYSMFILIAGANSSNVLLADDNSPAIKFQYHCFGYEESLSECAVSSSEFPATVVAGIHCGGKIKT